MRLGTSLSKDGTKLRGTADTLEGRDAIPRDPDSLEGWAHGNLVNFSKASWKVLELGWGNPQQQHRLGVGEGRAILQGRTWGSWRMKNRT